MDTVQSDRTNRYCPCPRCGSDRQDVEASCSKCQWLPEPPDRKSARWHFVNSADPPAVLELYEIISVLRWSSFALLGLLCLFGHNLIGRGGWAEVVVGSGLFALMLIQATRWLRP